MTLHRRNRKAEFSWTQTPASFPDPHPAILLSGAALQAMKILKGPVNN